MVRPRFLLFSGGVLLWNNLTALGAQQPGIAGTLAEVGPLLTLIAALVWARWAERVGLAELGFTWARLPSGLAWGLAAGLAMATPSLLFFAVPVVSPEPVHYADYAALDLASVLGVLLLRLPIRTVLVEETLFRGLIQLQAVRWLGFHRGIALCVALFVLWHVVITYVTLQRTNLSLSPIPIPALWAASAIPLAAGGLAFSLLRHHTGTLAAPMAAHWVVNASMLVFLFARPFSG